MSTELRETRPWKVTGARETALNAIAKIPFATYKELRRWHLELEGYESDWLVMQQGYVYSETTKRDAGFNYEAFIASIVDAVLANEVYWHHRSGSALALHLLEAIDPTHELFDGWTKTEEDN